MSGKHNLHHFYDEQLDAESNRKKQKVEHKKIMDIYNFTSVEVESQPYWEP